MRAVVVVLGDLPRSPRTVLHALALSRSGVDVDLIGFAAEGWGPDGAPANLRVWPLSPVEPGTPAAGGRGMFLVRALLRGTALTWGLLRRLLRDVPRPDLILVQNPPGIPTLAVAWAAARIRGARFAIDWHNLTWSMLALKLGPTHRVVLSTSAYERYFGKRADVSLFVSAAMAQEMSRRWGVNGTVFRDRPAGTFQPAAAGDRPELRRSWLAKMGESATARGLIVSSTSWSADEDFDLFFDALVALDRAALRQGLPPRSLIVVITGKGPLRDRFEQRLRSEPLTSVGVRLEWLEPNDYPRLLAAADLGVCLHRSASGLDLPMKVLDMFGAGLPVLALNYGACLSELVLEGVNGGLFDSGETLARRLEHWFLSDSQGLEEMRRRLGEQPRESWESAWTREVGGLLSGTS